MTPVWHCDKIVGQQTHYEIVIMLTTRQKELFDFIKSYIDTHSISPSFDEMKEALGLRSRSGVFRLLDEIEQKGFIRRYPLKSRAIEISPNIEAFRIHESAEKFNDSALRQIPFCGKLSFEQDSSILDNVQKYFPVAKEFLEDHSFYRAFQIDGNFADHMNLQHNDIVIIEKGGVPGYSDIALFLTSTRRIQLDFYSPHDIRKTIGTLKLMLRHYGTY